MVEARVEQPDEHFIEMGLITSDGESEKWVPVAVARVQACDEQGSDLVCMLHGESGEQAEFAFAFESKVYYVECVFPSAGAVTVSFETNDKRAKCM